MRVITFDIETQNFFTDVNSNDPRDLDMSVVCIHDSETGECRGFTVDDLSELWPILEQADSLVTWNGEHFDLPILGKYYPGDLSAIKHIDLMKEVQKVIGRRLKLDTVALATLGVGKSGHGSDAVDWWRAGEVDKVIAYCIDDVKVTRGIYDYALSNGKIKYSDQNVLKEIPLDTSSWLIPASAAMTFTLPF